MSDRALTAKEVMSCLGEILDPCSVGNRTPMSITEMGLVRGVDIAEDGRVTIAMRLTAPACLMVGHFKDEATQKISRLDGVTAVDMTYDAGLDWSPEMIEPAAQARRRRHLDLLSSLPSAT